MFRTLIYPSSGAATILLNDHIGRIFLGSNQEQYDQHFHSNMYWGNSTEILLLCAFPKNNNSPCNLQKGDSFQYLDLVIHINVTREWKFTSIPTIYCNIDNFSFNINKTT